MTILKPGDYAAGIEAAARAKLIDEIIAMYHTTRLRETPASTHILSKERVQYAFEEYEAALPLPTPVAPLSDVERLREALERLLDYCDNEDVVDSNVPSGYRSSALCDLIDEGRAALSPKSVAPSTTDPREEMREALVWQPIATAPKNGAKLLLCDGPDDGVYIGYWEADIYAPNGGSGGPSGWFASNWMGRYGDSPVIEYPVYWASIPTPPSARATLAGDPS